MGKDLLSYLGPKLAPNNLVSATEWNMTTSVDVQCSAKKKIIGILRFLSTENQDVKLKEFCS